MTSPSHQLVILYLSMNDVELYREAMGQEGGRGGRRRNTMFTPDLPCGADYLLQMASAMHKIKKCFSGAQVVNWMVSNADRGSGSVGSGEGGGQADGAGNGGRGRGGAAAGRGMTTSENTRASFDSTLPDTAAYHIYSERSSAVGLCQRLLDLNVLKALPHSKIRSTSSGDGRSGGSGDRGMGQAYPNPVQVSSSLVSRDFEDTYELERGIVESSSSSRAIRQQQPQQSDAEAVIVEKQEFEKTKEMKCNSPHLPPPHLPPPSSSTTTSPLTSSSRHSDSISSSASSSLNMDLFHDRADVFYRFTIVTYEEEEIQFLTESVLVDEAEDEEDEDEDQRATVCGQVVMKSFLFLRRNI